MEQDQLRLEWLETCEVFKMLEEREGQVGAQQG
ncbi:uncharacterized protein METZ01_LOCUS331912 [marine metagenome]|uniref:Uncharacterized protein n=1 Tax=marine metagenome TaxID=408172 RepID=A0A382Q296_9ZZZZ